MADEPLLPGGLSSRAFDGEGIAARPLPVIDEGVLRAFYVDTYYGRKLGRPPTTGSPSNVRFRTGTQDPAGILQGLGDAILVTSWLGGNANPTTGDFSFGIRGHVVRDGEVAEPVSETNVTGSYPDLLPRLVATGDDPTPWAPCGTPTLVFEDVHFAGA
jgi:PmbA protein